MNSKSEKETAKKAYENFASEVESKVAGTKEGRLTRFAGSV